MASNAPLLNQSSRNQLRGGVLKRMRSDSGKNETGAFCQTCDTQISDKIVCSGCNLSFCLKYARVSKSLYACFLNGELDDFHWTCACCKSMLPSLENIATTLQDLHVKSETRMNNIEDRMNRMENNTRVEIKENISNMKEEILESVKEGIDKLVDTRNKELEDRKKREMNSTVFNLPENECDVGPVNKQADESAFTQICSRLDSRM